MISELLGLYDEVVDPEALTRTTERFRERNIVLPTFAQLADPTTLPAEVDGLLEDVGPDDADARNLWRVHWYNADDRRGRVDVPGYIEIPSELSGVDARIVLALGHRFPMITAHKVLAAYSCLAPKLVAGAFDPPDGVCVEHCDEPDPPQLSDN